MAKLAVWSWLATVDLRGPTKRQLSVGSAVRHPFLCATWPIGPSAHRTNGQSDQCSEEFQDLFSLGNEVIMILKCRQYPLNREKKMTESTDDSTSWYQHDDHIHGGMNDWDSYSILDPMSREALWSIDHVFLFKNTLIATIDRKIKGFLRFCFDWFPSAALWIANYTNPGSQFHPYPKK